MVESLLFIEYSTSAGHHKTCIHTEMRKKTQNAITHYSFIAESDGERTLKIGQHLAKLWKLYGVLFFDSCGTLF